MDAKPDFHVVSLRYRLRPSDRVTYENPPPVEFETGEARFRLAEGKLNCELKSHFSTQEEARAVVAPILRAWEVDGDLRWNRGELRFDFEGADIIDRSPLPPGVVRGHGIALLGMASLAAVGTVSVHVTRARYPGPPGTFRLNLDAESIFLRYQNYLDGREPFLSMAYFCLTVLQAKAGGRVSAAKEYRIDKPVLNKIGELTTKRGDSSSARKAVAKSARQLTGAERAWLEAVLKEFIWRLGDTRPAATLPLITLANLPML